MLKFRYDGMSVMERARDSETDCQSNRVLIYKYGCTIQTRTLSKFHNFVSWCAHEIWIGIWEVQKWWIMLRNKFWCLIWRRSFVMKWMLLAKICCICYSLLSLLLFLGCQINWSFLAFLFLNIQNLKWNNQMVIEIFNLY